MAGEHVSPVVRTVARQTHSPNIRDGHICPVMRPRFPLSLPLSLRAGDADMSFISGDSSARATRTLTDAPDVSFADVRGAFRSFTIVLTAVMLRRAHSPRWLPTNPTLAPAQAGVSGNLLQKHHLSVTGMWRLLRKYMPRRRNRTCKRPRRIVWNCQLLRE
jgi:hypothetical protein